MENPADRINPAAPNKSEALMSLKIGDFQNRLFGHLGKTGISNLLRFIAEHHNSETQFIPDDHETVSRVFGMTEVYGQIHKRQHTFSFNLRQSAVTAKQRRYESDFEKCGRSVTENKCILHSNH